jgi:hypothetical protein
VTRKREERRQARLLRLAGGSPSQQTGSNCMYLGEGERRAPPRSRRRRLESRPAARDVGGAAAAPGKFETRSGAGAEPPPPPWIRIEEGATTRPAALPLGARRSRSSRGVVISWRVILLPRAAVSVALLFYENDTVQQYAREEHG